MGSVFLAYWYYRTKGTPVTGETKTDTKASREEIGSKGSFLDQILAIGKQFGLTPTSTTGGQHVAGSLHYAGRAADFSLRGVSDELQQQFTSAEEAAGFSVHEEYAGSTPYSTGHHLHVSKPYPGGGW